MTIIQKQAKQISLLLDGANYIQGTEYRWLKYVAFKKVDGKLLCYNVLTRELVLLDECDYYEKNGEICLSKVLERNFVEKYFLVEHDFNDALFLRQLRETAQMLFEKDGLISYVVFTTTACNARCFYCFEAGTPVVTMDPKIANDVADFIIKTALPGKNIYIRWFGGEPLCNCNAIEIISKKLAENNKCFKSEIVTNGYLFDENLIKTAKKQWKTNLVQITLDGQADTYNRVKNYKNGDKEAYHRVMKNIAMLLENGIHVDIRLNIDFHNATELIDLVDELYDRFSEFVKKGLVTSHAHPIFEETGYVKTRHDDKQRWLIADSFQALQKKLMDLGFVRLGALPKNIKLSYCAADSRQSVLISPHGKLGRCEHFPDSDFFSDIYNYKQNVPRCDYFPPTSECDMCIARPDCFRPSGCTSNEKNCHPCEKIIQTQRIYNGMEGTYRAWQKEKV